MIFNIITIILIIHDMLHGLSNLIDYDQIVIIVMIFPGFSVLLWFFLFKNSWDF